MKFAIISITYIFKLLGTTLAYVAPELMSVKSYKVTKASDVYATGISIYEILSACGSPWEDILPIFSDVILMDKVLNGVRPNINSMSNLYEGNSLTGIIKMIEQCLDTEDKRPVMAEVGLFYTVVGCQSL